DSEVALEVGVVVPGERGNAVALLQPELVQGGGEAARGPVVLAVAVRSQRLVGKALNDLVLREQRAGAIEQVVERERHVHHRRLHRGLLVQAGWSAACRSRASARARYSDSSSDMTTSES